MTRQLLIVIALLLARPILLKSQTEIKLNVATTPSSGQPGTNVNVTGSGFPSGTILADNITVSLSPAAGGPAVTTPAISITTVLGTSRRISFPIPTSIAVASPTNYVVSISGTTTAGI